MLTVSRKDTWICCSPTLIVENNEFVLITLTMNGYTFCLVYLKDLYLAPCYLHRYKLNALSRIASCMIYSQRSLILNSFIPSHFSYCLIVWMFYSRNLNERINHTHERAVRIFYKDLKLSFQELRLEDNSEYSSEKSVKTCDWNLQS